MIDPNSKHKGRIVKTHDRVWMTLDLLGIPPEQPPIWYAVDVISGWPGAIMLIQGYAEPLESEITRMDPTVAPSAPIPTSVPGAIVVDKTETTPTPAIAVTENEGS